MFHDFGFLISKQISIALSHRQTTPIVCKMVKCGLVVSSSAVHRREVQAMFGFCLCTQTFQC